MSNPLKKEKVLDKKEIKKALEKAEKDLSKKPTNSSAITIKIQALLALGMFEEFEVFIKTLGEEIVCKPKVSIVICHSMHLAKYKLDGELFKKTISVAFSDEVKISKNSPNELKTIDGAQSNGAVPFESLRAMMRNSSFYTHFKDQKELLEEIIDKKMDEMKKGFKKSGAEKVSVPFKVAFEKKVLDGAMDEAYVLFGENKEQDLKQHKTAFKLAQYFISLNEFMKAYEVVNYCLLSAKKNKEYLKVKSDLENELGMSTQEIEISTNEITKEEVHFEVEKVTEKRVIIPLNKQIRSFDEIKTYFDELSVQITDAELDEFINVYQNEVSMANANYEINAAIAKYMLQFSRYDDALKFIDESIVQANNSQDIKEKKLKKVKKLKHQILYKGQRYDEADKYLNDEGLSLSATDKDKLSMVEEVVQEKNTNIDDPMNAIRNKYHAEVQEKSLHHYLKRVDEYINERQFSHRFGVEVPREVVDKIKEKIALDLKYLDFEIREDLIPYLIKIESSVRYAFSVDGDNVVYKFLEMIHHEYKDDYKFIFDIDKIGVDSGTIFHDNPALLMEMLTVVYRITRNHVMHGTYNIFGIKMNEGHVGRVNKDLPKSSIDNLVENFDNLSMIEMESAIQGISASKQMDALYDLEIVKNIMSKSAIENRRVLGLMILLLYISNPYHTFMNIASSIDNKINLFRNRTVFGSKDKIYESLGLNVNWLKAFE